MYQFTPQMRAVVGARLYPTPGAGTQPRCPTWVAGTQLLELLLAAFQGKQRQGARIGAELGLKPRHSCMGRGHCNRQLNCQADSHPENVLELDGGSGCTIL